LHRNFCALNKHRNLDELEALKSLLTKHKQHIASKWPSSPIPAESTLPESTHVVEGNAVVEEQVDGELEWGSSSTGALEDGEEGFIRKRSPEILHLNRELRDYLYQGDMALTAEQAERFLGSGSGG